MKEQYVTYRVAKLLKEKGFDWDCNAIYGRRGEFQRNTNRAFNNGGLHVTSAPTQQMACRWLMEEKHIFIGKSFTKNEETLNLEFYSPIFNMDTCELITTIGAFCPEDAVEAALEYCLTNLI